MANNYVLHNAEWNRAMANCSPAVRSFLKRLDEGDSLVQYEILEKAGLKKNGYFFDVTASLRSMSDQIKEFKKGRSVTVSQSRSPYGAKFPYRGVKYVLDGAVVTDREKVVTEVFGGKSRHNYGLAVDLRFSRVGWKTENIQFGDIKIGLKNLYKQSGLPLLAMDCGLFWGGEWQDLFDPYHFEDRSYRIPDGWEYNYDDNCNFDFIKRYNDGTLFDGGEAETKQSSFSWLNLKVLLGVFAVYFLYKGFKK